MPTSSLYRANTRRAHAPEPDADPRRHDPAWVCLRSPNERLHYVRRKEADMIPTVSGAIRVLTGNVYGWKEVRT